MSSELNRLQSALSKWALTVIWCKITPCWRVSSTLGHSKQRKDKHDWLKSFGLDVACSFRAVASMRQDKQHLPRLDFGLFCKKCLIEKIIPRKKLEKSHGKCLKEHFLWISKCSGWAFSPPPVTCAFGAQNLPCLVLKSGYSPELALHKSVILYHVTVTCRGYLNEWSWPNFTYLFSVT